MTIRTWLLGFFSLIVAGACLALPFVPQTILPFNLLPLFQDKAAEIQPSPFGVPLPAGLEPGDRIYMQDNDPVTRAAFIVGLGIPPAGTTFTLHVRRNGEPHSVDVKFVSLDLSGMNLLSQIAGNALVVLVSALGLLLLWRGRGLAALGVAVWCFSTLANAIPRTLPLPFDYSTWLSWTGLLVDSIGTLIGLYLIAQGLTADTAEPAVRRRLRSLFWLALAIYISNVLVQDSRIVLTGDATYLRFGSIVVIHVLVFIIPLWILLAGRRRASPVNRARIRWILFSLVGLLLAYLLPFVAGAIQVSPAVGNLVLTGLSAAAFTGFAYAVLKHRLVSLELVLNRALVYGLITSLVVGVFAALLAFLERTALNTETNRFLALLIPLLLGMGLNALKQKVDLYINRYLFRHRHRAEAALGQFARTCAFVEDPERLLDLAAEEVFKYSGSQNLAIYLSQPGAKGAKLVRQKGTSPLSAKLMADDLAYLRLKAGDAEVDLHGVSSALGSDGYAYGLMVRGEVLGIMVCGPRPAESYSPEERRLFAQVAHQTGIALHALRLQEQQRLLRDIADGTYKNLPTARAKAKALIGPRLAS